MAQRELKLTPEPAKRPIVGYLAVGFGIAGIFASGLVFVPLAFVFSVAAMFIGQAGWGVFGVLLSMVGFLTTPTFLIFIGLQALHLFLQHLIDSLPAFPGTTEV